MNAGTVIEQSKGCVRLASMLCGLAAVSAFGSDASAACWVDAATRYALPPALLVAIAEHESALNPKAINTANRNGTRDIGLMQINSMHLPVLARVGVTESDLFDPCVNIHVGAWVLASAIAQHGYTWDAVGAYNAGSTREAAPLRAAYA